jgi:hypothetical protein
MMGARHAREHHPEILLVPVLVRRNAAVAVGEPGFPHLTIVDQERGVALTASG